MGINTTYATVSGVLSSLLLLTDSLVWTNFEIADMDFWRGEAYTTFFDFLDAKGGFYYEVRADSRLPGSYGI